VAAYENLISEFLTGSGKVFADQIEEVDLLRFCDGLCKRNLSERTVMNYYSSITTFLRSCGLDHKILVAKEHRPHKEDPDPEAYTEDEICTFLVGGLSTGQRWGIRNVEGRAVCSRHGSVRETASEQEMSNPNDEHLNSGCLHYGLCRTRTCAESKTMSARVLLTITFNSG
jgi:hypothetical protein